MTTGNTDTDTLEAEPTLLALESGTSIKVERLKTRGLMALLKILTRGAAEVLPTLKFDVLLTTYEMVISDATALAAVPWAAIVVDEAHRLKNAGSRLVTELERFNRDAVVLLTGTPIQNRCVC